MFETQQIQNVGDGGRRAKERTRLLARLTLKDGSWEKNVDVVEQPFYCPSQWNCLFPSSQFEPMSRDQNPRATSESGLFGFRVARFDDSARTVPDSPE